MLHITRVMISTFNIKDMDFMGYSVDKDTANFHHLIIPRRNGGVKSINNGAVLNSNTSHPYLHIVEFKNYDMFYEITREMIEQNKLRRLDYKNLARINDILNTFEREYSGDTNYLGECIIKEEYTKRLLK